MSDTGNDDNVDHVGIAEFSSSTVCIDKWACSGGDRYNECVHVHRTVFWGRWRLREMLNWRNKSVEGRFLQQYGLT